MTMRNLVAPALLATLLFASPAAAAGTIELAVNGGFETGDFTGWTPFPNGGSQTISITNPSDGTYSGLLSTTALSQDNLIKQANVGIGLVSPGDTVYISFDYRGTTAVGGVIFAEFFSELDGGGTSAAEILTGGPLFPNANPDVWTSYVGSAIAGPDVSGGVTLQLKAGSGGAPGSLASIYFDNVSMTVVPEPGSLAALAIGGIGVVARRRRRS